MIAAPAVAGPDALPRAAKQLKKALEQQAGEMEDLAEGRALVGELLELQKAFAELPPDATGPTGRSALSTCFVRPTAATLKQFEAMAACFTHLDICIYAASLLEGIPGYVPRSHVCDCSACMVDISFDDAKPSSRIQQRFGWRTMACRSACLSAACSIYALQCVCRLQGPMLVYDTLLCCRYPSNRLYEVASLYVITSDVCNI